MPHAYDRIIDQSLDYIKPILSNNVLDKDRQCTLASKYSKTITQYKFDLMTLHLDTIQSVIRSHQQLLNDLQEKLTQTCNKELIQAIQHRQQAMKDRHEIYLKHKLNTFFDEAPMTSNEYRKQFRRRRSKVFIYTKITASLPFIEVDLNLTPQQMSMLIKGLKYILPCQHHFSRKPIEDIVNEQYESISNVVKNCLRDHRISTIDERAKQAFKSLRNLLIDLYAKPLPNKLAKRAKCEHETVRSIKQLLRERPDIVIHRTDKSKVFFISVKQVISNVKQKNI